jgi:hypothetical protein
MQTKSVQEFSSWNVWADERTDGHDPPSNRSDYGRRVKKA